MESVQLCYKKSLEIPKGQSEAVYRRQHNGQKKKYKQRSTQYINKTKDRVTGTPLKSGDKVKTSSICYQ